MPPSVFLSYRREDSAGYTRALYNALVSRFGAEHVFMDVDTLKPGVDFVDALEEAVAGCQAFIAVIGPRWTTGAGKQNRLSKAEDYVRLELETALRRETLLVPVLVDGAEMPAAATLPESLLSLTRRNALTLGNERFNEDMQRLIAVLEESVAVSLPAPTSRPATRRSLAWTAAIVAVFALSGAALWLLRDDTGPEESAAVDSTDPSVSSNGPEPIQEIVPVANAIEVDRIVEPLRSKVDAQDRRLAIAQQQARSFRERALAQEQQLAQLREAVASLIAERQRGTDSERLDSALEALRVGNTAPAETVFAEVEAQSQQDADNVRAAAAARHRGALAYLHDTEEALTAYRRAVELDPENPVGWNELGHLQLRLGALPEAQAAYERVLELGKRTDDRELTTVGYGNLGNVAEVAGDLDQAAAMYHRALDIALVMGNPEALAHGYSNLGTVYRKRREFEQAQDMYRRALEIYESRNLTQGMIGTYSSLGSVHLSRGELAEAEAMYERARALSEAEGIPEATANAYGNLGLVHQSAGDLDLAEAMLRKSLEIETELGHLAGMAADTGNLATVHLLRGELNLAELLGQEALDLERSLGRQVGMASAHSRLGLVYRMQGDSERDEAMHRSALEIDTAIDDKAGMARDYSNLGLVMRGRGKVSEARALFEQALNLYQEIGADREMAKVESWLQSLPASGEQS